MSKKAENILKTTLIFMTSIWEGMMNRFKSINGKIISVTLASAILMTAMLVLMSYYLSTNNYKKIINDHWLSL